MSVTKTAALKEVRKEARENNMTFKASGEKYNGEPLYGLFNRKTGERIISNYRLWSAYWNSQRGEFKAWAKKKDLI